MKYISTRSKIEPITSAQAILQGLSEDGGLFVPEEIPAMTLQEIEKLIEMNYPRRAATILKKFLTDYTDMELGECAELIKNFTMKKILFATIQKILTEKLILNCIVKAAKNIFAK